MQVPLLRKPAKLVKWMDVSPGDSLRVVDVFDMPTIAALKINDEVAFDDEGKPIAIHHADSRKEGRK